MRCAAAALVLAACAAGNAHACDDDWLDVAEDRLADGFRLRATNLSPYPLTFTLRVKPRGLRLDGPREITASLSPREARNLMHLQREGGNKGHYRYYCDWTIGRLDARHDEDQVYVLPYSPGSSYRVLQGYGSRFSHTGREQYAVDFKMVEGTPVHAARSGVVARIEESNSIGCWEDGCGRYANYIVVLHDDDTTGEYYHLAQYGALVEPGERVRAGQEIGLSGNTGHTTMPHLHFAVYRAVDWGRTQSIPVRFLSADGIISRPRSGSRYPAVALEELPRITGTRVGGRAD